MKKIPLLLITALLLPGCAHHEKSPGKVDPYTEWNKKKEQDDDDDFFYRGWLNPRGRDRHFDGEEEGVTGDPTRGH